MTIKGLSFKQNNGFDISEGNNLILENVGRIIMTYRSERVNNPEFGSLLEDFLFNRRNILVQHVENNLKNTIELYEPKVVVSSINVTFNKEEAHIRIQLRRKDTLEVLEFKEVIEI